MDYSLKANLYLRGVASTPCPDCPPERRYPIVSIAEKTKACIQYCKFALMIWILSEEQRKIWEEFRPPEMKEKDIQKAIDEKKFALEEAIARERQ